MKRTVFLSLIIALITGSCTQEKKSPIEGNWQLVYAKFTSTDKTFPAEVKGGQIKTWANGYFTFVGHFEVDTIIADNYGAGTYKFEGNRCEAMRLYHSSKSMVGKTGRWLIEIKNDTLIQKQPADENWNLPEKFGTEIYVRLK
jgi:hypothetical protein